MKYTLKKDKIIIDSKEDFCPQHIFECGQFFAYKKTEGTYEIFSSDRRAIVKECDDGIAIETKDVEFFERFLDLKTDYAKIKQQLSKHEILQEPIKFGWGIRILKQRLHLFSSYTCFAE